MQNMALFKHLEHFLACLGQFTNFFLDLIWTGALHREC